MNELDQVSVTRNNEAMVVKKRRRSRIVKRDRSSLVVVRQEVHKGKWRVDDLPIVHSINSSLAGGGANKELAFGYNGQLQGCKLSL